MNKLDHSSTTIKRAMNMYRATAYDTLADETTACPRFYYMAHSVYQAALLTNDQLQALADTILRGVIYPEESRQAIICGRRLGWPARKIYRRAIQYFEYKHFFAIGW